MALDAAWQDREDVERLRRSLPLLTTDRARLLLQEKLAELESRILAATRARERRAALMLDLSGKRRGPPSPRASSQTPVAQFGGWTAEPLPSNSAWEKDKGDSLTRVCLNIP